ncbi:hypothetical protein [Gemmatimonas sp.]
MVSRTDRRSTTTTFSYDGGWKVSQSSIGMSTVPDLVDQFVPAETRGLVAASGLSALADTALAYTRHDGPRSDVGDSASSSSICASGPRAASSMRWATPMLQRGDAAVPAW